ncbi:MAG: T9SS type A sorting domain-containing protein [Ignavibacteriaceae bacterium]
MKFDILKYYVLLLLTTEFLFPQPENPGSLKAGWSSVTVTRNGRTLNSLIYYPAFSEGSQTQVDSINKPYPVIAFGHGFFMQNSYYISLFKHLATHGYLVIAPQFPDVNHSELADDLLAVTAYIKHQNSLVSSPFFNLIDTLKTGLSGHSMGGGASLLAAARESSITVVAPLAPAETNPSVIAQMNSVRGVVWLIAGSADGITPFSTNQLPMYNNSLPVKGLVSIKGGNHTKFMDIGTWDWTDPNGNIARQEQLRLTRRYMTSIFNLFLKGKKDHFDYSFGLDAQSDSAILLSYQLKPLIPTPFSLIAPFDSVSSSQVAFSWNNSSSLNLYDSVKYELTVSEDSLFQDTMMNLSGITDTSFEMNILPGVYFWKVRAYTSDSTVRLSSQVFRFTVPEPTGLKDEGNNKDFRLYQNYPNPFNPVTLINYHIPFERFVTLKILDIQGKEVALLVNELQSPGTRSVEFNAPGFASGVYICHLQAGEYTSSQKLLILK